MPCCGVSGWSWALANMAGGYLGARTAVKQGNKFIRIVFLAVVGALIIKLGSDIWQDNFA